MNTPRRILICFCLVLLSAGAPALLAYPVSITINATLSSIPGQPDPLTLGSANPPITATITTILESSAVVSGSSATYPATVTLNVGTLIMNAVQSGTVTINSNGHLTANFADKAGTASFAANVVLPITFPSPIPTAFGSTSFSAPASTISYALFGSNGVVGVSGTVTAVGLTAGPSTISSSYQQGGASPASVPITIGSNDPAHGALNYTIAVAPAPGGSTTSFLTLSATSGSTPGTIVANFSTALSPGTYSALIQVNTSSDSSGAPLSIPVTYTVSGNSTIPSFQANPAQLSFTYTSGDASPPAQTVSLTATTGNVGFTATSSASWLVVTAGGSSTPANLSVSVNPVGLPIGTSSASINVNGGGLSLSIPVSINVSPVGGTKALQLSAETLFYQFYVPGSTSSSQTVSISSGGVSESYTASVVSGGSFLTVSPSSGATPSSVTITANTAGLALGAYSGSVMFSSPGQAAILLPITVFNGLQHSVPITLSPSSLTFNYVIGGATPSPQTVQASSPSPVQFTVNSLQFYLPVTPGQATTNATFTVGLDPSSLNPGTYHDAVLINSDIGAPYTLPVTVNVTSVASTTLSVSPLGLAFTYPASPNSPLSQTLAINAPSAIPYTVTTSTPWLSLSTGSGTTNGTVIVTANLVGLTKGTYQGSVVISSPSGSNSPLTVPVTIVLAQDAPASVTASPTAVAFSYEIGGVTPIPQIISFKALPATAQYSVTSFGASWLSVVVAPDFSNATLSVNPAGLTPGIYNGSIKVSGTNLINSPFFIPVTLTVSTTPNIGVSPGSLTFSYQPNGTLPPAQMVAVSAAPSMPFQVSSDSSWLVVTPLSGNAPGSIMVSASPAGLANGTYHGTLTIVGGGLTPGVARIPVALNIATIPAPNIAAVTNGISYVNSYGSPGLIIAVWGTGLGPAVAAPLQLNGNQISNMAGGTQVFADGIPCPILFASAQQVNAVLPFSLDGKASTSIQLQYQGITSNTIVLPIQPAVPALFSADASGTGQGAILNQDLSLNSATNPAHGGSIVVLYGGGAGQTNPPGVDGLIVPLTPPFPAPKQAVTVSIGGVPATILYAGDAPGLVSGVIQVNAMLPPGLSSGPQKVVMMVGTASSQGNLTVFVQ